MKSTPPKLSTTSVSPAPSFALLRGLTDRAFTPKSSVLMASLSRMAPRMIAPAQPLAAPAEAIKSPISALAAEYPPSTTKTSPSERLFISCLIKPLSRKHLTVRMRPQKRLRRPKLRNWISHDGVSGAKSIKSEVANSKVCICGS